MHSTCEPAFLTDDTHQNYPLQYQLARPATHSPFYPLFLCFTHSGYPLVHLRAKIHSLSAPENSFSPRCFCSSRSKTMIFGSSRSMKSVSFRQFFSQNDTKRGNMGRPNGTLLFTKQFTNSFHLLFAATALSTGYR